MVKIADYIPAQDIGRNRQRKIIDPDGKYIWRHQECSVTSLQVDVSHAHVRYIKPFPKNLGEILYGFEHVIIPELNSGQLIKILRDKFLIPAEGLNKVQGMPFTAEEILTKIENHFGK